MSNPDAERIRREARARIADRPSLVLDGDPIEELARAHERHAQRLLDAASQLEIVGSTNFLGNTSEGRAATHNIRVATVDHKLSVRNTIQNQASDALRIAEGLRIIRNRILTQEVENTSNLSGQ